MEISSAQVCDDLVVLIKHVKRTLAVVGEEYGLTPAQLSVLTYIQHGGAVTMGGAASNMHCDASNITGIIDRLVAQGLVTRRESKSDRRAKLLELTTKGAEMMDGITSRLPDDLGCGKLSVSERTELHRLITQLM